MNMYLLYKINQRECDTHKFWRYPYNIAVIVYMDPIEDALYHC